MNRSIDRSAELHSMAGNGVNGGIARHRPHGPASREGRDLCGQSVTDVAEEHGTAAGVFGHLRVPCTLHAACRTLHAACFMLYVASFIPPECDTLFAHRRVQFSTLWSAGSSTRVCTEL